MLRPSLLGLWILSLLLAGLMAGLMSAGVLTWPGWALAVPPALAFSLAIIDYLLYCRRLRKRGLQWPKGVL